MVTKPNAWCLDTHKIYTFFNNNKKLILLFYYFMFVIL